MAVQSVVSLRDVPVGVAITLCASQAGSAIYLAIAQAILLNKLLPAVQAINPSLSMTDLLRAGATGLKGLVAVEQVPDMLIAYADSLSLTFKVAAGVSGISVLVACGVDWKSLKQKASSEREEGNPQ